VAGTRLDRNVIALGVVSLLNDVSSEMIFPLLPAFLTTVLGAGPTFLGAVEGAADSVSSLLRIPAGWFADRSRRKPLVVAGYATANLVRPAIAAATAPWHVLAIRLLDRVGKGVRTAPRDALLADSTAPENRGRAFGFHRSMDHVGAVVGPLLASLLFAALGRSYRGLFLIASLPGLATVLFTMVRVREARPALGVPRAAAGPRASEAQALAAERRRPTADRRRFRGLLAAVFLFGLGNSSDAFLLLRLEQAGIDVALLPFLWSVFHVMKVASAYPLGRLSDRVGRVPIILAGWSYYAIVYAGFAAASSPLVLAGVFVAYGLFYGFTEGAERALVSDLVPADRRGVAYGLYNAAVGFAALPASVVMGALWQAYGQAFAFGFGGGMAALGAIVLLAVIGPRRPSPRSA
jgi:MFS family permease